MSAPLQPTINACLNFASAVLLLLGYRAVKRTEYDTHIRFMIAALVTSALFLASYLLYHAHVGSVPYARHDWTRLIYFAILIPHSILAGLQVPFIILAVWYGYKGAYQKHTRITRWLWPVWMFVSLSGVLVYLMLYQL